MIRLANLAAAALTVAACASVNSRPSSTRPSFEAISLQGDTLRVLPLAAATRARYEQQLAEARVDLARRPNEPDALIWVGRRLGYLGRFNEAIEVFSEGFRQFPGDARFLRHRGHRYISTRQLDRAVADLELASSLTEGKPDEIEPDGQPNARNQPIGTLHSNIAYHLGLAYYLQARYDRALQVYERELRQATNDDRRASVGHWMYMTLRRLGRDADAAALVRSFRAGMDVVENQTYLRLLLMYKGELPPDSLLASNASEMSVTDATAAYGVGNWHLANGDRAAAERIFRRIIAGGQWGAFGYIAAEADLARMARRDR